MLVMVLVSYLPELLLYSIINLLDNKPGMFSAIWKLLVGGDKMHHTLVHYTVCWNLNKMGTVEQLPGITYLPVSTTLFLSIFGVIKQLSSDHHHTINGLCNVLSS